MPLFEKNGRRIVFIHIPKAAGSSVEALFKEQGWSLGFYQRIKDRDAIAHQHYTYSDLKSHIPDIDDLCSFAIVRDPFDRIISEWVYQSERMRTSDLEFNDFVRHVDCSLQLDRTYWDNHWRPQTDFIDEKMNLVIKMEKMNEVLLPFLNDNEIIVNPMMPHTNRRKKRKRSAGRVLSVNAESRDRILRIYARDYDELGYSPFVTVTE